VWLCENDPDVVLLDYSMTGIKSGRLQNIIRVLHPELPWLYFSGHTHAEAYHQALADNAFGFIEKPFDPIDLETKLEAALHVRRERRNLESRLRTLLPQIAIPLVLHSLHSCGYQRMPAKAFKELVSSIDSDK
jgi:DNA-binding NtrC family response regulator